MGTHYRFIFNHDEYRYVSGVVEDYLDKAKYTDKDFDSVYLAYRKLQQPRNSSSTTKRFNFTPLEKEAVEYLIKQQLNLLPQFSADYDRAYSVRLKIAAAKQYSNNQTSTRVHT